MEFFFPGGKPKAQTPANNRFNAAVRRINERGAAAPAPAPALSLAQPFNEHDAERIQSIQKVLQSRQRLHKYHNRFFSEASNKRVKNAYEAFKTTNPEKNAVNAMLEDNLLKAYSLITPISEEQKKALTNWKSNLSRAEGIIRGSTTHRKMRRRRNTRKNRK